MHVLLFCFLAFFSPQKIQEGQTVPYFQIWSSTAEGYMSAHPWTDKNISMGIKDFAGWEPQNNFFFFNLCFGQPNKSIHSQSPRDGRPGWGTVSPKGMCMGQNQLVHLSPGWGGVKSSWRRALSKCAHRHQAASRSGSHRIQDWNLVPPKSKSPLPTELSQPVPSRLAPIPPATVAPTWS